MANRDDRHNHSDHGIERRLTLQLCELIDSPRALAVAMLARANEWLQLLDLDCKPSHYTEAQHFADDYLVTEILSKSCTLETGIDTSRVAVEGFFEAEEMCKQTNLRFSRSEGRRHALEWAVGTQIRRCLAPLTEKSLGEILDACRHGPGASTSVSGNGSVPSDKFDGEIHLTPSLVQFARALMGDLWADMAKKVIIAYNKHTTVPKNAKKDRNICVEPGLNLWFQLGIGRMMRRLLLRAFGVDLSTQKWNQFLASKAHEWRLATIDLSMASDTVAKKVIETLFPADWLHLLQLARTPYTKILNRIVELEKFSSMGNGFTFELETMLFTSIVYAIVPKEEQCFTAVYGDDIIVPQKYAVEVVEALDYFGFRVNGKKTALAGSFFESCGTDWFNGSPVRPFYCRRHPEDSAVIPYSLHLANSLRLYAAMRMNWLGCDERYLGTWKDLVNQVSPSWRRPVPPQLGDVGLISDVTEFKGRRAKYQLEGWFVPCIQCKPQMRRKRTRGRLLAEYARIAGRKRDVEGLYTRGREPIRGYLGKPVTKQVLVSDWTGALTWW